MGGPRWKREVVPDHKFDFVDTRDFTDHGIMMRLRYFWIYISVLISFLVYMSNIYTAVTMITTQNWSNQIFQSCNTSTTSGCVVIPFSVGRWIFLGCVIFSFLLLAYESRKAKKIIASRDISYAYTNLIANNYYSIRSYDHFCFFHNINNSTKKTDDFAFFIFFTFKSWKRLLLADGPRQVINALTLYSFYLSHESQPGAWYDLNKYTQGDAITTGLLFSTGFTVIIFAISAIALLAAGILYIPLLCYIRGNLKEYCCHKVDKRIAEIVKRKNKERFAKAAALAKKEAAGDFTHLKNKKGELVHNPLPQPTLPNVTLDDLDDSASTYTKGPSPSVRTGESDYHNRDYKGAYGDYPPPALPYNQEYPFKGYGHFAQSVGTLPDDQLTNPYNEEEFGSQVQLTRVPSHAETAPPSRYAYGNGYSQPSNPVDYYHSSPGDGFVQQSHQYEHPYVVGDAGESTIDLAYADTSYYPPPTQPGEATAYWSSNDPHGRAM